MQLHAIHSEANTITISAQDTDVLLQLLAHCDKFECDQLWMKSGKDVHSKLPAESDRALLASHLLTGCDTSDFAGHSKTTAYRTLKEHHNLISSLGDGKLTDDKVKSAERFICKLCKVPDSVH